ncbi:MAG: hypothetical protein KDH09_18525 [Chrysiogenetes bacterium]|nr:hypothetical protein [Chrysiogenetes bacterium]
MARTGARTFILLLSMVFAVACSSDRDDAPAPDVTSGSVAEAPAPDAPADTATEAAESAPAAAEAQKTEEAPTSVAAPGYQPGSREPDYKHLAQIRKARDEAKGKLARMYLKFSRHHEWIENTVVMLATDGSYASVMLHYDEGFKQMVLDMKKGYVYELEFEVNEVSSGGQPRGEILSIDRRSSGPVADQTKFLPAVEAVQAAKQLPEYVKEARRKKMRETLENLAESVEENAEAGPSSDSE